MPVPEFIRTVLIWGCLFGLYLLLTGQPSTDEVMAGLATAAVATAMSLIVRGSSGHRFRRYRHAWLPAINALKTVPGEVVIVAARLVSAHAIGGGTETEPLEVRNATGRAIQILATSFAPNRYVISQVKGEQLLLHRLVMPARQPGAP
jgi:multisubunit Na+/H+ antiporter MnhE subunit